MTRRRIVCLLGILLLAAGGAAGCGPAGSSGGASARPTGTGSGTPGSQVSGNDHPARAGAPSELAGSDRRRASLQRLRRQADIAPCPRTSDAGARSDGLPDLTLECLGGGRSVRLAGLRGTPTVINVWAQWCGPCRDEAPHLQAVYERAGSRLRVIGIDYDDPRPARALAFARELGLRYPQLVDPDKELRGPFRLLVGIPATAFVDAHGRLVHVAHKPYRSEAELVSDVREYLGVSL